MGGEKYEFFQSGSDFDKIHFLDNFSDRINIEEATEQDTIQLLQLALKSSNDYIKRSAVKILCTLTLTDKIENPYLALGELHNLLKCDESSLQVIAIKYLPYFPQTRSDSIVERLKELSDSSNGEVASEAYFCLGLFQLTEAISLSTVQETITCLEKARPHFLASNHSTENRTDAEFYLLITDWLESVLGDDQEVIRDQFNKIEDNLSMRSLYDFGRNDLELDFLIFKLVDQLHTNFSISSKAKRWIEVRHEVNALLQVHHAIRQIKNSTLLGKFLSDRIFSNVFEIIEDGIYQTHLSSDKERLKILLDQETETPIAKYLRHLIPKLPENGKATKDNPELLALLSEIEGSDSGLALYNSIADKSGSTELLREIGSLIRKYKNQRPYKSGTIYGQEVYNELRTKIEEFLPQYPQDKFEAYFRIVEEVIRYARMTFVDSDRKRFAFLYAKTSQFQMGKGQGAIEEDLQGSMLQFFEHSSIKDGLDHEKARFVDGGRVDIVYKRELITIPIELKKSLLRPTTKNLEDNYIAQAQTYTAGYDQLGIFVLLELSDKGKEPPPNFKDWFNIHHLPPSTNSDIRHPDYVISVVIPGNRTSPSSKSVYK